MANNLRFWRQFCAALLTVVSFAATEAHAQVLLDTFAPGDSAPGSAWSLYSRTDDVGNYIGQNLAVSFTASTPVTVDTILAAIGGSGQMTLGIMGDLAGIPTNSFLYSSVLINPEANVSLTGLGWTLGAGTYWLAAVADPGFSGQWSGGIVGAGWAFTYNSPSNWVQTSGIENPAVRITSAVPEPETYAMFLAGLGLIAAGARRRKQQ